LSGIPTTRNETTLSPLKAKIHIMMQRQGYGAQCVDSNRISWLCPRSFGGMLLILEVASE
jgi:hypothetical protein